MYKNILLPVALDHATDFNALMDHARRLGGDEAHITALSVIESLPVYIKASLPDGYEDELKSKGLDDLRKGFANHKIDHFEISSGHPAEQILAYAEAHHCDLIITEATSSRVNAFMLGSVSQRVARRAGCTVLVCR